MFIDQAEIYVRSGKGGHGCVSFHRAKYVAKGGPDGGNGGEGGSIVIKAAVNVDTLLDFAGKHHWIAENGRPGEGGNRNGRNGEDLVIEVPPGTIIYDKETGVLLKDLKKSGDSAVLCIGGNGGRGNKAFATPTDQTPREAEPGGDGQERWLRLDLRLIADVGVVGLPNAGKSTLLARLSQARPKIADYPFTTLKPQLGIVELSGSRRFVMADIPGLIEGASEGAGLGHDFLRHIERTRVLLHLVDLHPMDDGENPVHAYETIRRELDQYSEKLGGKPELVVANKLDLGEDNEPLRELEAALGTRVLPISAATGMGLEPMLEQLWELIQKHRPQDAIMPEQPKSKLPIPPHLRTDLVEEEDE